MRSEAVATTREDNDQVRVTTWTFAADGAATGHHRHLLDYIVVPVTGGIFTVVDPDGSEHQMVQELGVPYFRPAGAAHDVVNASGREAVFVEIELKD